MTGILLCGGESSRMKTDKGLLKFGEKTWAETAYNKLSELCDSVFCSVKQKQVEKYSQIFDENQLIIDSTELNFEGPLAGLLSCHLQFPNDDFLVLACDFVEMKTKYLVQLQKISHEKTDLDAVCYLQNDGKIQPLISVYKSDGLKKILQLYHEENLMKKSMIFALEQMNVHYEKIPTDAEFYFKNYNQPEDLKFNKNL